VCGAEHRARRRAPVEVGDCRHLGGGHGCWLEQRNGVGVDTVITSRGDPTAGPDLARRQLAKHLERLEGRASR